MSLVYPLEENGYVYVDIHIPDSYRKITERLYSFNLDYTKCFRIQNQGNREILLSSYIENNSTITFHQQVPYRIFINVGVRFVEKCFIKMYLNHNFVSGEILSPNLIFSDTEQIHIDVSFRNVTTIKNTQFPVLIEFPYPINFEFYETYLFEGE